MVQIPKHIIEGGKRREVFMTKEQLQGFEKRIADTYNDAKISAPIHLSDGNEEQLINIFQYIGEFDWVFSSWRNHYHALLHGVLNIKNQIEAGKSMSVHNFHCDVDENGKHLYPPKDRKAKFYSSSIVGGTLPISLGVAKSVKLNDEVDENHNPIKVWCFVGDMTFESGIFHEVYKYARNHDLPLEFVIEDNGLSTNTPTEFAWGKKQDVPDDVIYYKYKSNYPHHGTGNWVMF